MLNPFHLAILVNDIERAREFYGEFLGFEEGRSTEDWIDWNFFGHQLVTHLKLNDNIGESDVAAFEVNFKKVPVPHFGVVLNWKHWHDFAEKLKDNDVEFVVEPHVRFEGGIGEQVTMFFQDPSGNSLEFKAFKDEAQLFAKYA